MASSEAHRPEPSPPGAWVDGDGGALRAGALLVTLGGILALVISRSPHLVTRGRFWAEEGAVHVPFAMTDGAIESLTFVYERAGYVNLHVNLASLASTWVPLVHAPLVTVWLSALVLLVLAWCALAWPSDLLRTRWARLVATLLLVAGPLAHHEVWLTSLHAQVYLGLFVVLLAFVPAARLTPARFGVGLAGVVLGGLSGLYSVALVPLYWWRAWQAGSRRAVAYAAALSVTAAVQAVVVVSSLRSERLNSEHATVPRPGSLYRSLAGRQAGTLLLGPDWGDRRAFALASPRGVVALTCLLALVGLLVVLARRLPDRRVMAELAGAFLLVQVLVQVGSIAEPVGGRYAVVPLGIVALMIVHGTSGAPPGWARVGGRAALALLVVVWSWGFCWGPHRASLACQGCPDWSEAVAAYESGQTTRLRIWPYRDAAWFLELPPPTTVPEEP